MSEDIGIPRRDEVLVNLRSFLRDRGEAYRLESLGCFGSVARQEANADSDVDVVYRLRSSSDLTLFDLALMREELVARLGRSVDLIEWCDAMPQSLKERVAREAIYA